MFFLSNKRKISESSAAIKGMRITANADKNLSNTETCSNLMSAPLTVHVSQWEALVSTFMHAFITEPRLCFQLSTTIFPFSFFQFFRPLSLLSSELNDMNDFFFYFIKRRNGTNHQGKHLVLESLATSCAAQMNSLECESSQPWITLADLT